MPAVPADLPEPLPAPDPPDPDGPDLLDRVRERCRAVADQATAVRIDPDPLHAYASGLVADAAELAPPGGTPAAGAGPWDAGDDVGVPDDEHRAALVLALDAINFGSGFHDEVRKLPGCSGATTMATHLRAWAVAERGIDAGRLAALDQGEVHRIFDQPTRGPVAELMGHFAEALTELGHHVQAEHGSSFTQLVAAAEGSTVALVERLAALPTWSDTSRYRGLEVPFLKRAQLAVADLDRAFGGRGLGAFAGIDRLTAFADNLVPHVLRVDGVLVLDPDLETAIDHGELLEHGGTEEVELRACGVHAVEQLRSLTVALGCELPSSRIDQILWTRGGGARYKAIRRPRARTTAY